MNDKFDFKAFEEGGMDEFLRKTIDGHRIEPKPALWKAISRKLLLQEILSLNFKNLSTKYWVAGAAGLLVLTAAIYFNLPDSKPVVHPVGTNDSKQESGSSVIANTEHLGQTTAKQVSQTLVTSIIREKQIIPFIEKDLSRSKSSRIQKEQNYDQPATQKSEPQSLAMLNNRGGQSSNAYSNGANEIIEEKTSMVTEQPAIKFPYSKMEISRLLPFESGMIFLPPAGDTIISINSPGGIFCYKKSSQNAGQFFSANLGIEPEMAFYADQDATSKLNFWINGTLTYHISRFSIATGLGLGYVFDEGKYRIDYQSLDSIGYFTNVVSFTTGTNNEIIYNSESKNVYDSLLHMADDRTRNRYTYLQVPFLLGYRIFESNKVSLTFQVGPAVSFLIGSHESSPVINYPNARIIKIEEETPARVTTNWQLWANLNLEIRLNRKISLYFEPSYKYFLKPMVEQENVSFKAPWSVGLGIGLQFNFGKK